MKRPSRHWHNARSLRSGPAICLALLLSFMAPPAEAYETAWAFVYPVGREWERPNTPSTDPNAFTISQGYCVYSPPVPERNFDGGWHTGVDLANGRSGDAVRSIANGEIADKQTSTGTTGWGNMIRIRHRLPDGSFWYSQYGHMLTGSLTSKDIGDDVQMGEQIGEVGTTGASTGFHLHLEIKTSDTDGPGYLGSSACNAGGFTDPLDFIEDRFFDLGTANTWPFSTNGQKDGWTTVPYEGTWSVTSGRLNQANGDNSRILSPYMNRVPNAKIYVKLVMSNTGTCGVGQFYLQTDQAGFTSARLLQFSLPTGGATSTIVIPMGDVPGFDDHPHWRRFRIQLPGTCNGTTSYDYIRYQTDNTAPTITSCAVSPATSPVNAFTASWGGYDGPDDGTGSGAGIGRYETNLNGQGWIDRGLATSLSVSANTGSNFIDVRATDKVGNVGTACRANFDFNPNPGPCDGRQIPASCVSYPATPCYPPLSVNLKTLPELSAKQWLAVGLPVRDMLEPDRKYSVGFEYRAAIAPDFTVGLATFNPMEAGLGLVVGQSTLPTGSHDWRTFWSAPFTATSEQLRNFPSLRFALDDSRKDYEFEIRNVRILSQQ